LAERGAVLHGLKIGVNDISGSSGEFARYVLAAASFGGRDAIVGRQRSVGTTPPTSASVECIPGSRQEAGGKNTSVRTSMLSRGGAPGVSGFSKEV
jgi:hypothetical protein